MKERNYDLIPDGEYITLQLKNGAGIDYFTPNRDFLNIMNKWHISPFVNGGRLQCDYWQEKWKCRNKIYLHDLTFACYRGMVHAETLSEDIQNYFNWKEMQGLTIDHLDSNVHNNTIWNLAPMPLSANVGKKSFPAGFVSPYVLTTAFVGEEFRVQLALQNTELGGIQRLLDRWFPGRFTMNGNAGISAVHFICTDSEKLVSCLKYLYDTRFSWCNPDETARNYKRAHKDIPHMAADIQKSLAAQRALAQMDRVQFQIFTPGE